MKNKKTAVVGLSGGVDSAVTAFLLKKQGYNVIGAFMKNFSDTKNSMTGECSWLEDKRTAQKVAAHLKIPFVIFDFEKEYKRYVIEPMFSDYKKGLTPNPDALCNKIIKFPLFWKKAKKDFNADYIAMGHYVIKKKKSGRFALLQAKDKAKDQSYFLWQLTQEDVRHALFPIGDYTKAEVRKIAKKNNFPNYNRKGTSGICFVGKVNLQEFLKKKIKPKSGKIKNSEGDLVGKHNGIMYYTIGQRAPDNPDFYVNKEYRNKIKHKLYIIDKNAHANVITIAPENHPSSFRKSFLLKKTNWINPIKLQLNNAGVRIRHLGKIYPAIIKKEKGKTLCILNKPLSGIAPGQSAVIYKKQEILGGGEIRFI